MSTLHYRLRVRNAADDADLLSASSLRSDDNPYIAAEPSGDGESLDPLTGKVTVGAYTISVIDAVDTVATSEIVHAPDFGDYADTTALLADWAETDPGSLGTWTLVTPAEQLLSVRVPQIAVSGTFAAGTRSMIQNVYGGFTPGATVRVSWYQYENQANPHGAAGTWNQLATLAVADGSGNVTVTFAWTQMTAGVVDTKYIQFDQLVLEEVTTGEGRIVTSVLSDGNARQQLLSKKAFVEISEDEGVTWDVMLAGYVNHVSLLDALRFEFTVGESKRVEQTRKVFDRIPTADQYAAYEAAYGASAIGVLDRASCIVGGPIVGDWGPSVDRGRPVFTVERVSGQVVFLKWVEGFVSANFHEREPPVRDDVAEFMNDAALEYLDSTGAGTAVDGLTVKPLPGLVCRIYDGATGEWVSDHVPMARSDDSALLRRLMGDWVFCGPGVNFYVQWTGTPPSEGDRVRCAVFPRAVSERNPFHWSGHPVDLAAQLFALSGIAFDAESQTSVKAALGNLVIHIRITASATLQEFLEQTVYGPFGFATRSNDEGEAEFFLTRTSGQTPVATVTLDDLFSDDGTVWELEEASAANLVTWQSKSFLVNDNAGSVDESTPIDCILEADIRINVDAEDAEGQAVFGEKEVRFDLPGEIQGYSTGSEEDPGSLDLYVAAIAQPLFDWNGRGAIRGEFHVGRWSPAYAAVIGEELVVNCPHIPSAALGQNPTSQRGTFPRRGFVLHKTVSPSGATFKLEDRGPTTLTVVDGDGNVIGGGIMPEFTLAADATFPKKVVEVTVTNEADLDLAAVVVRVEMSTDASPTAGQYVRTWTPGVGDNPFDLPPVCAGSLVSVRMRAEGTGTQAGAFGPWTDFQSLDLADLTPPTALAATVEGTNLVLTWTLGEASVPVEVLYRLDTDTVWTPTVTLPAGSTSYTLSVPSESADYVIAVRHVDGDCRSTMAEVAVSTDPALVLNPPIDPAAFSDGLGHHGLEVTAQEIPSATEFWGAIETGIGTGIACDYVLVGTITSVPDGRTRFQHPLVAPQDGLLRFWKARHIKPGFDPSAFTDPVSIYPWLVLPPDPEPGNDGDPDPDAGQILRAVPFEIIAHRAGPMPWGFRGSRLTAEVAPLSTAFVTEDWFDLTNIASVRMTAMVHQTSVPVGSTIAWQYTVDDGEIWSYLDGALGPDIRVDEDSLTADGVLRGEWVSVALAARTDVRLRAVFYGGDETGTLILGGVALQGRAQADELPAAEQPEPPEETPPIPGSPPPPAGCNGTDEMPHFAKLVAWWVSDCSETITVDGKARIVQINDQSGNGNHLAGYGASGNYVYLGTDQGGTVVTINGREVATFDAAYLSPPPGMMDGITDATMTVVLKGMQGDPGAAPNYVYSWKYGSSSQQSVYAGKTNLFNPESGTDGHIHEDFGSTTRHDLGNPAPSLASPRVYQIRAATNVYRATLDGAEFHNNSSNTVGWAATAKVGNRGTNSKLAIAAIAIHQDLTNAEAADVAATMGDTYAISVAGGSVGGDPGTGGDPGDNTGGGPDGDDPVPTPSPAAGDRPFAMAALPSTGGGVWNAIAPCMLRPNAAPRIYDQADAAGLKLMAQFTGGGFDTGPNHPGWRNPDETFNLSKWKQRYDEVADLSETEDAVDAGLIWCAYLIDEPKNAGTYGGQAISKADCEAMCAHSLARYPDLPTLIRIPPLASWYGDITGCSIYWASYHKKRGDCLTYRNTNIAAAQAINKDIVVGLNVIDFGGTGSGYGRLNRWASAADVLYYGKIMAGHSYPAAFGCWRFEADWYAQVGMPAAWDQLADYWASFDP